MANSVGGQLRDKIAQPIKFQYSSGGGQPSVIVHGFDVAILIDVCRAVVVAGGRGTLNNQQQYTWRSKPM